MSCRPTLRPLHCGLGSGERAGDGSTRRRRGNRSDPKGCSVTERQRSRRPQPQRFSGDPTPEQRVARFYPDPYPVVDLFAGPGGLGEGFASVFGDGDKPRFTHVVSIERDEAAYRTLQLRHFYRSFPSEQVPEEYYSYLRGDIGIDELYCLYPNQYKAACRSALKVSLGAESPATVRTIIHRRLAGKRKWALVGGPPCQAYSLVGRSRMMGNPDFEQDERHFLYREYLKIIIDHRPPVFVMENVKGLLSAKADGKSVIGRIVSDLSNPTNALGDCANGLYYKLYSLTEAQSLKDEPDPRLFLVRSENYGVPQARHRMFIVGIRSDIEATPKPLHPHRPATVLETIGHLPRIRSGVSRSGDGARRWRKEIEGLTTLDLVSQHSNSNFARDVSVAVQIELKNFDPPEQRSSTAFPGFPPTNHAAILSMFDPRLNTLTGHESRSHMASDLRRYLYAAVFAREVRRSPKLADFPTCLLPKHKNVEEGRAGRMFSDRFRVQLPDGVSTTITSHISKDGHYFIHYDPAQCRSLTVREAARLQTFPDNYKFEGSRTSQYHQVGNAVPPYLATQIGQVIAEILDAMNGEA